MDQDEWRKLAEQNPMRVTYPSWRPKEHWEAKRKADPWVLMNGTRDWRKADSRKATFTVRTPHAGFQETRPCDPPSGMKLEPRPKEWAAPAWARRRRYESDFD